MEKIMTKKKCNHCGEWKDENEFNWRYKSLGVRNKACRDCQHAFNKAYYEGDAKERHLKQVRERTNAAREVARKFIIQYLLMHPCEKCGERDPIVLEFHHVGEKDLTITRMVSGGWSIKRIQQEIDKCQVLCANCHRKVTVEERGWFKGKKKQ
jgi:hypothetical protein